MAPGRSAPRCGSKFYTKLRKWSLEEKNIHAAISLGSQARDEFAGAEWSDLDVLNGEKDNR